MTKSNTGELIFFWILFGIVGYLSFGIMSPYFTPLFLAGVFAVLFSPLYRYLLTMMRGRETLAALFTVLLVLCLILIPLMFLGVFLFQDVFAIYGTLTKDNSVIPMLDHVTNAVQSYIRQFVPSFTIHVDIALYIKTALTWIAVHLNQFFTGILSFMFEILLIIVAMFFFLRDGKKLQTFAIRLSPLADSYDESIITKLELAVTSIVKGTLVTAFIQGIVVGIGFAFFDVPNPVLWGSVAVIAALIPAVGSAIITVPAALFFLFTHQFGSGVGLLIWALFVGTIDNFLRPFFIKRGVDVHPFFIILSVLGGLTYFGPVGFLAGPVVLAFFFTLLEVYPSVVRGRHGDANTDH